MYFGFALVSPDVDLRNIIFLDTHLDLFDTDIPSKPFVSLQDVLRDFFKMSWKTKNCFAEDALKTSWRHILKTSWRPRNVSWNVAQLIGFILTGLDKQMHTAWY